MTISSAVTRPQGVVILGVPRSGTTLLRRLLNGHPDISCPGETFLLTSAARFLRSDRVSDGIDYGVLGGLASAGLPRDLLTTALRKLVVDLFRRIADRAGKSRWASKTAIDAFYLPEIELLMAGHARFVCIVRHGLDTALSLKELCDANETYIREIHAYIVHEPRPLLAFARLWADTTSSLLDFAERRGAEALLLCYEDLVARPDTELQRLAEFLDLAPDSLDARSLAQDAPSGLGDWKSYGKTGIDAGSIGRWKQLTATALSLAAPVVNPVLTRAGYEAVTAGPAPSADQAMRRYEITMGMQAKHTRERGPGND